MKKLLVIIAILSLSIPTVYYFVSREVALIVLTPMMLLSIIIDLGRYFYKPVSDLFYSIFAAME